MSMAVFVVGHLWEHSYMAHGDRCREYQNSESPLEDTMGCRGGLEDHGAQRSRARVLAAGAPATSGVQPPAGVLEAGGAAAALLRHPLQAEIGQAPARLVLLPPVGGHGFPGTGGK